MIQVSGFVRPSKSHIATIAAANLVL